MAQLHAQHTIGEAITQWMSGSVCKVVLAIVAEGRYWENGATR
jgi:hypothetical protein